MARLENARSASGSVSSSANREQGLEKVTPTNRLEETDSWTQKVGQLSEIFEKWNPTLLFFPNSHDWNRPTGRTSTYLGRLAEPEDFNPFLVETEYCGQMPAPNLLVESSTEEVADLLGALSHHEGELKRNPFHLRMPSWMQDNVRRGAEVVGGQEAWPPLTSPPCTESVDGWTGSGFPHGKVGRCSLVAQTAKRRFSPSLQISGSPSLEERTDGESVESKRRFEEPPRSPGFQGFQLALQEASRHKVILSPSHPFFQNRLRACSESGGTAVLSTPRVSLLLRVRAEQVSTTPVIVQIPIQDSANFRQPRSPVGFSQWLSLDIFARLAENENHHPPRINLQSFGQNFPQSAFTRSAYAHYNNDHCQYPWAYLLRKPDFEAFAHG